VESVDVVGIFPVFRRRQQSELLRQREKEPRYFQPPLCISVLPRIHADDDSGAEKSSSSKRVLNDTVCRGWKARTLEAVDRKRWASTLTARPPARQPGPEQPTT
jgi:hypothetical protein